MIACKPFEFLGILVMEKQGCNILHKMLHPCSVIYIGWIMDFLTLFYKKRVKNCSALLVQSHEIVPGDRLNKV